MFDKQYRFRGSHADRVTKLTSQFESISGTKVFERNVDVLCNAPLIGFLYNRRADLDNTKNPTTNEVYNTNVMGDRVIYSSEEMLFNFRLIMLLDSAYEHDAQKRIDKLTLQQDECKTYEKDIAHLAALRIALDLDDGVKVNYVKAQTAADGKNLNVLVPIK